MPFSPEQETERQKRAQRMLRRHQWLAGVPTAEDPSEDNWLRMERARHYTVTEQAIRYTLRRYARLIGRQGETIILREHRGGPPLGLLLRLLPGEDDDS